MKRLSNIFAFLLALLVTSGLLVSCKEKSDRPLNTTKVAPVAESSTFPSERLIAPKSQYRLKESPLVISPDARRVAYRAMSWGTSIIRSWVVVDGVDGKKYDNHYSSYPPARIGFIGSLTFSPNNERLAYVVSAEDDKSFVVVDGKEGKPYDSIVGLTFSPNSKRLAHWAVVGDKSFVVVDGSEGKQYDLFGPSDLRVSGPMGGYYLSASGPIFSPDSRHLAYLAREDGKRLVVVDRSEQKRYDSVGFPVFSPDSKRLAYTAQAGNRWFVVADEVEGKQYDSVDRVIFSPDSKRLAYVAISGDKGLVVVDGVEGKPYDSIDKVTFSPDSQRLVYVASTGSKYFVVVNGVEGKPYDSIDSVIFSPDSKRLAYGAKAGGKYSAVVDGVEAKQPSSRVVFSPDSQRLAYVSQTGDRAFVVVDGVEGKPYGPLRTATGFSLSYSLPIFSPDSRHVVYVVNNEVISVDGIETQPYGSPVSRIIFDSGNGYHYLAEKDGDIYLVEREIP